MKVVRKRQQKNRLHHYRSQIVALKAEIEQQRKYPKDIDVVFKPWKEWHALTEDLKEARRLLRMVLEADGKGRRIDVGQIEGFLK